MVVVDLTNEIAINTDGVCGGIMDIFVEPWHKNGTDVAGGVLDAVARADVAVTATVVSRSRGLPVLLGEKLLLVDGRVQSGGSAGSCSRRASWRMHPASSPVAHRRAAPIPSASTTTPRSPGPARWRFSSTSRCRSRRSSSSAPGTWQCRLRRSGDCSISRSSSSTIDRRSPTPSGFRTPTASSSTTSRACWTTSRSRRRRMSCW